MPFKTIENHRRLPKGEGQETKSVLVVWTEPEASQLEQLGIPSQYYMDSRAAGGLANFPMWMIEKYLKEGQGEQLIPKAQKYPLETPEIKVDIKQE